MRRRKHCPVLSALTVFGDCMGRKCEWYVGGRCAIYILARDFVGSARILAKAFERGEVDRVVRFLKYGEA